MSAVACFNDASQASVLLESPRSPNLLPTTEAQLSEPRSSDASIVLEVGERQFKTRVSTLTEESSFFASMFSGRWPGTLSLEGGSIFVDADPDLFQHILRYLRRGVFPIFWNRNGGFDYCLYARSPIFWNQPIARLDSPEQVFAGRDCAAFRKRTRGISRMPKLS